MARGDIAPKVVHEFDEASKGMKLKKKIRKRRRKTASVEEAYLLGADSVLDRFGIKEAAAEEVRLKIRPLRGYHGFEHTVRSVTEQGRGVGKDAAEKETGLSPLEPQANKEIPAEALADILQNMPAPNGTNDPDAKKNPLDRTTSWGPASHPAAGNSAAILSNSGGGGGGVSGTVF